MADGTRDPEDDLEGGKMPLLDHLLELRRRLMVSVLAFFACFILGYTLAEPIFTFLVQPLADITAGQQGRRMIYTALHEAFFTYIKVGFFFRSEEHTSELQSLMRISYAVFCLKKKKKKKRNNNQ